MVRFYITIIIMTTITGMISLGYYYYTNTEKTIKNLTIENTKLLDAVDQNEKTITNLISDIEKIGIERNILDNSFKAAQSQIDILEEKLSKHDIDLLAVKKPKLVENIINKATNDVNRCFEILSGSPLTLEEINATKPSEINNSCPDIANPNYSN